MGSPLTLRTSTLRARPTAEKAKLAQTLEREVWPKLEAGQMLPQIYREFALADAAAAHALMESSAHIGKIMLKAVSFTHLTLPTEDNDQN